MDEGQDQTANLGVAQNVTASSHHVRPERSPLHDVRQHARRTYSRGRDQDAYTRISFSRTSIRVVQVDRIAAGGARRDRTDDLLLAKQALSQLSYGPAFDWQILCRLANRSSRKQQPRLRPCGLRRATFASLRERRLVGLGRFELPTSRLSSARSNQLSYRPNPKASERTRLTHDP